MISSRREMLQLAGASIASAAALSVTRSAQAQVAEEAGTEALTITRKGIDKDLDVINVDLLEEQAKDVLSEGVYVFIASNGPCARICALSMTTFSCPTAWAAL